MDQIKISKKFDCGSKISEDRISKFHKLGSGGVQKRTESKFNPYAPRRRGGGSQKDRKFDLPCFPKIIYILHFKRSNIDRY